jgi:hypothetical protein
MSPTEPTTLNLDSTPKLSVSLIHEPRIHLEAWLKAILKYARKSQVRPKKSKAIDSRFDWIKGRVRQLQLIVSFIPGALNLSDLYTKSLPKWKHQRKKESHGKQKENNFSH